MQTELTLKYSSFFFHKSISLIKNETVVVDINDLTDEEIETLNTYITIGAIVSSEGLLYKTDKVEAETKTEDSAVQENTEEGQTDSDEDTTDNEDQDSKENLPEIKTVQKTKTATTRNKRTTTKK